MNADERALTLAQQTGALEQAGCERILEDTTVGVRGARPGTEQIMAEASAGDVVHVTRLDRLGRSTADTLHTLVELDPRGVAVVADDAGLETSSSAGRTSMRLIHALAGHERDLARERTIAGMKAARERGGGPGRKPSLTQAQRAEAHRSLDAGEADCSVADNYGVSHMTIRRLQQG